MGITLQLFEIFHGGSPALRISKNYSVQYPIPLTNPLNFMEDECLPHFTTNYPSKTAGPMRPLMSLHIHFKGLCLNIFLIGASVAVAITVLWGEGRKFTCQWTRTFLQALITMWMLQWWQLRQHLKNCSLIKSQAKMVLKAFLHFALAWHDMSWQASVVTRHTSWKAWSDADLLSWQ